MSDSEPDDVGFGDTTGFNGTLTKAMAISMAPTFKYKLYEEEDPGLATEMSLEENALAGTAASVDPSALMIGEDGKLFSTRIVSHLGPVRDQVDKGQYWMKRMSRVATHVELMQREYSKKLIKVIDHERTKVVESKIEKMPRWWNCVTEFHSSLAKLAVCHQEFAAALKRDVIRPLDDLLKKQTADSKAIFAEAEVTSKQLAAAVDKVKKAKTKTEAAIKVRDSVKEKEAGMTEKQRQSRWTKFSTMLSGTAADADTKVKAAAADYEKTIAVANEEQNNWKEKTLPKLQNELERLEFERLTQLTSIMTSLSSDSKFQAHKMTVIFEDFNKVVEELNPKSDIRQFVRFIENEYGPPRFPEPMANDVQGIEDTSDESVFKMPLKKVMDLQRKEYPELKLEVPRIVHTLVEGIKKHDGFMQEGIFRISAEVSKVVALRERITAGDYDFDEPDSFILADLLKVWFRELPDCLFGEDAYNVCIELGKNESATPADYKMFFDTLKIPSENKAVLRYLFNTLLEVCSDKYLPTNKMNARNLAIVFAPTLLKAPSGIDFMVQMQNTPYETAFMYKMITSFGSSDTATPTTFGVEKAVMSSGSGRPSSPVGGAALASSFSASTGAGAALTKGDSPPAMSRMMSPDPGPPASDDDQFKDIDDDLDEKED